MKLNSKIVLEVAFHEAIIRQTYKDSQGVWTWSVGLTSATGHNVERYIDNPQSLEKCLEIYIWALKNYAEDVREVFKDHPLTEAQFAAALSFHWNTGSIKTASWPRYFKQGNMTKAEKSFMEWRKPPSIINRRKKEADLLFRGVWSNNGTMTEYTRLTTGYTPVWSSAKTIHVKNIVEEFLKKEETKEDKATSFIQVLLGVIQSLLSYIRKGEKK